MDCTSAVEHSPEGKTVFSAVPTTFGAPVLTEQKKVLRESSPEGNTKFSADPTSFGAPVTPVPKAVLQENSPEGKTMFSAVPTSSGAPVVTVPTRVAAWPIHGCALTGLEHHRGPLRKRCRRRGGLIVFQSETLSCSIWTACCLLRFLRLRRLLPRRARR